jgi:hypothetical protein
MSTTEVTSWAVDLATLGPIYPFVGTEVVWVVLGVIFWLAFHIWQVRFENRTYDNDMARLARPEDIERAMRRRRLD